MPSPSMWRRGAAVVACAVLLAACGSDDIGDEAEVDDDVSTSAPVTSADDTGAAADAGDATDPEEIVLTDSFRGVTAEAIKIGVVHIDLEPLRGLVDLDHGDYEAAYRVLIDEINAEGGVLGRSIEPVFGPYVPLGQTAMDEVCAELTLDEEVFAVVGDLQDDGPLCYTQLSDTIFFGNTQTDARLAASTAPWFTAGRNADEATEVIVRGFEQEGVFDDSRVAVVGLASDSARIEDLVVPLLDELGVDVVDVDLVESSLLDEVQTISEVKVMSSRQDSLGVDVVLTIDQGGPVYARGIEETAFRPRIATTSLGAMRAYIRDRTPRDLAVLEGSVAGNQLEQLGWWDDPAIQDCIGTYEAATGETILDPNTRAADEPENLVSIAQACRFLNPFVAILEAAGADLTNASVAEAGASLGAIHIPGLGPGNYGPDSPDGDASIHFFEWDDEVADLRRTGTLG